MDMGVFFPDMVAPKAQHSVDDLSPHVDGGQAGTQNTNAVAGTDERQVLFMSAGIVLAALALLWMMGALAFRGARL